MIRVSIFVVAAVTAMYVLYETADLEPPAVACQEH